MKLALTDSEYMRYSKQILLMGESEQLALMNARVAIIGVGGLGQLLAQYLAASGIGSIHLFDGDTVASSNLPRQLLYQVDDIGFKKALISQDRLNQREQRQVTQAHHVFLSDQNYSQLLHPLAVDLLFDCSDNFQTRQLINRFAIESQTPLISAAISADHGQWFAYLPTQHHLDNINKHGCYHCLYPADTHIETSCRQAGVLGPAVGVMASLQGLAGMNHLMGRGVDYGVLHRFDAVSFAWSRAKITLDKQCPVCQKALNQPMKG